MPATAFDRGAATETADRGRSIRIAGVVTAGFCVFLQLYATQPLLALFRTVFGASEVSVSMTVSAPTIAVALASPLIGALADALGRKRVIVPSLLAIAVATFACGSAQSLGVLVFWRFVGGVFAPGVIAVVLAYISEECPAASVGSITGYYVTGTVLGGLTGRLSAAFLADHVSWRAAFRVLGALSLAGGMATWALLPRSRRFRPERAWKSSLAAMAQHWRNPKLVATYFAGFNVLFCHVGLFTYASFRLAAPPFSLSTAALGSVFLVYALGLVVTPLAGRAIDRYGFRAGMALAVATVVLGVFLTLPPSLPLFVFGVALASTGVFMAQASASSHVGRAAATARSSASGQYVACYYLGGALGAMVLALPWHASGWTGVVAAVVVVQMLVLIAAWRHFERGGAAAPAPGRATGGVARAQAPGACHR